MNNTHMFDALIIGGGFSGVITTINLLRKATRIINIGLINDNSPLSKGIAYSTTEPYHLLNVPADKMSAYPDIPNDFVDWLEYHPDYCNKENLHRLFVPRMIYGEYIQFQLNLHIKRSHSKLDIIKDEAIAIHRNNNCFTITLKTQKQTIQTKKTVLALGNALPFNLLKKYNITEKTQGYICNPWNFSNIKNIPKNNNIFIIGSGLTTIDLLLTLQQNKHQGRVNILSRHGLLPKSHKQYAPLLIDQDIINFSTALKSLSYVKYQLKKNTDWRALIDSIRPMTQDIWQNWNHQNKTRFLKHLRAYWDVHRHRIAPEINQSIQQFISSNQIIVYAGNITKVQTKNNKFDINYLTRHDDTPKQIIADNIINATGPNYTSYLDHPLIQSLIEQNLTCWDTFKLGFNTNTDSLLANNQNIVSANLYAIGPLTKSTFWEIIAVPDIREQAAQVTENILMD